MTGIETDKAFVNEYVDWLYGATQLMRKCCDYFTAHPNVPTPYSLKATWMFNGKVTRMDISASADDWEAWSNLTHINNIANCAEMIESGVYEHGEEKRIFDHKIKSSNILANKEDNSMNHIVRVPDVAKSFLLQFCTSKGITKLLTTKPV